MYTSPMLFVVLAGVLRRILELGGSGALLRPLVDGRGSPGGLACVLHDAGERAAGQATRSEGLFRRKDKRCTLGREVDVARTGECSSRSFLQRAAVG